MLDITEIPTSLSGTHCPCCSSIKYIKNGKEKGNQKYKCKSCGKHYRSTTGSSIHQIHKKSLIGKYIECLNQGLSLRKAAEKTGISLKTSFQWRHKLLASLHSKRRSELHCKNITATISIPYSEKGKRKQSLNQKHTKNKRVQCIFQTDNTGTTRIQILNPSACYNIQVLKNINRVSVVIPKWSMPNLYKCIAKHGTPSEQKLATNIGNDLQAWLDKFHGVATKYLHHYWAWYEIMNDFERSHNQHDILVRQCVTI